MSIYGVADITHVMQQNLYQERWHLQSIEICFHQRLSTARSFEGPTAQHVPNKNRKTHGKTQKSKRRQMVRYRGGKNRITVAPLSTGSQQYGGLCPVVYP